MSSTTGANAVPLEPNVVIANKVHDAVEADDTDHVEFDLDELKEQLGIDSILEKLSAPPRGGGTPLYGLYRYVRPQRVWFFSCFGHK